MTNEQRQKLDELKKKISDRHELWAMSSGELYNHIDILIDIIDQQEVRIKLLLRQRNTLAFKVTGNFTLAELQCNELDQEFEALTQRTEKDQVKDV